MYPALNTVISMLSDQRGTERNRHPIFYLPQSLPLLDTIPKDSLWKNRIWSWFWWNILWNTDRWEVFKKFKENGRKYAWTPKALHPGRNLSLNYTFRQTFWRSFSIVMNAAYDQITAVETSNCWLINKFSIDQNPHILWKTKQNKSDKIILLLPWNWLMTFFG